MSLQYSTDLLDAMLDAIQYGARAGQTTGIGPSAIMRFWAGALPANCASADTGTLIAEIDLAEVWADDAAAGMKALVCPLTANSVANATMTYYRIYASDGVTCHVQGTSDDLGFTGTPTLSVAQPFTVESFALTAPGA